MNSYKNQTSNSYQSPTEIMQLRLPHLQFVFIYLFTLKENESPKKRCKELKKMKIGQPNEEDLHSPNKSSQGEANSQLTPK